MCQLSVTLTFLKLSRTYFYCFVRNNVFRRELGERDRRIWLGVVANGVHVLMRSCSSDIPFDVSTWRANNIKCQGLRRAEELKRFIKSWAVKNLSTQHLVLRRKSFVQLFNQEYITASAGCWNFFLLNTVTRRELCTVISSTVNHYQCSLLKFLLTQHCYTARALYSHFINSINWYQCSLFSYVQ